MCLSGITDIRFLVTSYNNSLRPHGLDSVYVCGRVYDSVLVQSVVAKHLQGAAATGGTGDSFVLLPRILWCGVSFERAFATPRGFPPLGRLV